ncbi:PAS domain S-box protein [Natrarchaeobius halalkaliphilus]|uniref:histidine kinase n=1 Tax=Natrarchaeobius halalkaliphilus TaxID=1679091 RepID=A0A3N6P228_9EURY|nr:PAS domain S-box protein [Natrarchaeobius halalkaliphilus]RQG91619.1 PAS domain S-box protein [Natrarchaeobius halalkaliphilus]
MADRPEVSDGSFLDRTDERTALTAYRSLADAVDTGIYQLDADGRFVAVTDRFLEETGYGRDELLDEHVSTVLEEDDVDRLERAIDSRLEADVDDETDDDGDSALDLEIVTADGEYVACELRFSPLSSDGEFDGTVGVVRALEDHPRKRRVDSSTRGTDESLASVIDEADVGVFVLDEKFDVAWVNETTETYFGVDRADVIGRDKRAVIEETIRDRFVEPQTFEETVLATYDDNTYVEQFECRITAGDGREGRWLEHRSKPIESGQFAGGRIELYYDVTDRKASERARRESEYRFRMLVDAVDEYAIFMLDRDGRVVSWNEGAERIKGYEPAEILGDHFSLFYTDTDRENGVPERNLSRARQTGSVEDEGWRVRADGSTFWANVTITAIRNDGELQGYAKITRDMSDRWEREQQLQRERDLTEQILETSPVGIAVVNSDGSTSRVNERMATLLDVSSDDVSTATSDQRNLFEESLGVETHPATRVFETGAPLYDQEILLDRPDGHRAWLSINATPITDEAGDPEQVVVTATDITDLKALARRRKRDLEERKKELTAVQLATNLFEVDDQPIDELLSEFATKLLQSFRYPDLTAARVSVGKHEVATDGYGPLERSIATHTKTASGTPITIEVVLTETPTERIEEPFVDEERALIETLATLVKFYFDRRESVEELRAETRRLEQFAYAASHDLQEPLRMVSSYLQLIERRYEDALDEDGTEFLAFAIDGAERMREMIDGLLAYSRVETQGNAFEPVDLDAVLEDVLVDLEVKIQETDAEVTTAGLPTVEGDESQLRQVFQNLLDNAIEYGGDAPRVHVAAERSGSAWTVSIRDNGIGIDPEQDEQIFEVFERLHGRDEHGGVGIGLAICERVVERHGGEIWVESEPGDGTTFSFTLPA